ncbi:S8 family serine peptidase [Deinococcus deserti]|uniref:Putative Serine protease, subtilase family n=1 Tax=Deinococcus deserti (strain DSM 17065 / CIP 109153 / LMG 22923 / VCD115) TaxID=546414 RepID=C1D3E4_DEIDV|nr:S8 family serine peptidase [Deinococcus deserti]ACO48023.1 putative Serine protease, subtilase family, precursor [Deinococcus deserti VCD115]
MHVSRSVKFVGLALALAACAQQSNVPTSSVTPTVSSQAATTARTYLVGFKAGQGTNTEAIRKVGGQLRRSFTRIEAASATLTAAQANKLAADPSVEYVELTVTRRADNYITSDSNTLGKPGGQLGGLNVNWQPSGEFTYGDIALAVPSLRTQQHTGAGTAVCVGDTGIDGNHPEFAGKLKGFKNFMGDGKDSATALNDVNQHGTHVAGTIFAQFGAGSNVGPSGMDSNGVGGVAPGVNLYVARVLGDDGSGTSEGVVEGVNWCVSQLVTQGGKEQRMVVNLSLGADEGSKTEKRAFQAAYDAGALVVAAAGNDGVKLPHYPSDYPSVIKVGAVNHLGNLADFSNHNSKQELVAPDVAVLSSVPVGTGLAASASAAGVATYQSVNPFEFAAAKTVSNLPIVAAGGEGNRFCEPNAVNAALNGAIALISRGACPFADKVANAVANHAAAVIVYNNTTGPLNSVTLGSPRSIPVVGITQADGLATLTKVQAGSVTGSVSIYASDYEYFNGTSMATPHVAGAAAVVWAAKPGLSNAELRDLLSATATDLGPNGRDNFFGNGLVNPGAAIAAAGRR